MSLRRPEEVAPWWSRGGGGGARRRGCSGEGGAARPGVEASLRGGEAQCALGLGRKRP